MLNTIETEKSTQIQHEGRSLVKLTREVSVGCGVRSQIRIDLRVNGGEEKETY